MVEKLAGLLASKIAQITEEVNKTNIYSYGLQIILNTFISFCAIIGLGIILREPIHALFYLLAYCSIRLWAGGYHAPSNTKCILMFIGLFIGCVISADIIAISKKTIYILLLIENFILLLLSPVETMENPLPVDAARSMKLKAVLSGLIISSMIIIVDNYRMKIYGMFGVTCVVFLLFIGRIQLIKEKKMKKSAIRICKILGNVVFSVALLTVYTGHPHCLLILHQPKVPEELREYKREKE